MLSVPSTESLFSVQTSRVASRLPFSELSPSLIMTFPSRTETVSLLVARSEGKSEPPVPWETGRVDGRRNTSSYVFAGSTSATETGPLRVKPCHGLRRTVAKGRFFESSGRASKVHQETFRSIRVFALCKFAGWLVYKTLRLETSLKLRFFFSRAPSRPWRGRPHLRWP